MTILLKNWNRPGNAYRKITKKILGNRMNRKIELNELEKEKPRKETTKKRKERIM